MKKTKALLSVLAALTIFLANPAVSFAASSTAASTTAASEAVSTTAAETSVAADGTINAAPNTGVEFPPIAAVVLALSMVPVIVLAGKKSADKS